MLDKNSLGKCMSGRSRDKTEAERPSVLIIDDDEGILDTFSALISYKGYRAETAGSGKEAIEKSRHQFFNVALIDIVLPDISGTDLLVRLNETFPKMRKVIVTGNATLDNAVRSVNLGADAYLVKPVAPEELMRVIEEQLEKQREERVMTDSKMAQYITTKVRQLTGRSR